MGNLINKRVASPSKVLEIVVFWLLWELVLAADSNMQMQRVITRNSSVVMDKNVHYMTDTYDRGQLSISYHREDGREHQQM